jgi:dTDP-4-amino-4,6-dideoxygalactose transaminase
MIPFLDLPAQYRVIKSEIDVAVMRVIESSQFVLGDEVAAFERTFATYCGADAAIAVNSGTSALHLALLAYGIGPGDEVITVSMTFAATVAAVLYAGATPILVDVDPEHWTSTGRSTRAPSSARSRRGRRRFSPFICTVAWRT